MNKMMRMVIRWIMVFQFVIPAGLSEAHAREPNWFPFTDKGDLRALFNAYQTIDPKPEEVMVPASSIHEICQAIAAEDAMAEQAEEERHNIQPSFKVRTVKNIDAFGLPYQELHVQNNTDGVDFIEVTGMKVNRGNCKIMGSLFYKMDKKTKAFGQFKYGQKKEALIDPNCEVIEVEISTNYGTITYSN